MKKRILTALLAACLSCSLAAPRWRPPPPPSRWPRPPQVVQALGIMAGDQNGNMNLSNRVTRAEFVTMAVKATPGRGPGGTGRHLPLPRCALEPLGLRLCGGRGGRRPDLRLYRRTFRPGNHITLAEGATIVLQLLDYGPGDFTAPYPTGQLAMYRSLRLDRGVTASAAGRPAHPAGRHVSVLQPDDRQE